MDNFLPNLAFQTAHQIAVWVPYGERMCDFARRIARDEMCNLAIKDGFDANTCPTPHFVSSEFVSKSIHKPVGDNARILSRYFLQFIRWRGINLTHPLRTPTESENMSPSFANLLVLRALYSFCNAS